MPLAPLIRVKYSGKQSLTVASPVRLHDGARPPIVGYVLDQAIGPDKNRPDGIRAVAFVLFDKPVLIAPDTRDIERGLVSPQEGNRLMAVPWEELEIIPNG